MLEAYDIPDLLANLVERSLVACDPVTGSHQMTESMRAYAMEHLDGEDAKARLRHFRYFTHLAEHLRDLDQTGEETTAFLASIPNADNFRSAYEWSFTNDPDACLHLTSCLFHAWQVWSLAECEQNSLRILEAAPNAALEDQIWLRSQLAFSCMKHSNLTLVEELLIRALEDLKIKDIPAARAAVLSTLGWQKRESGDEETGISLIREALQIAKDNGIARSEASALTHLGEYARQRGEFDAAEGYYLEALSQYKSKHRQALNLFNLGQVSIEKNDPDAAKRYYLQGLACVEGPTLMPVATVLIRGLSAVLVLKGDYRRAGLLMGWAEGVRIRNGGSLDSIDRVLFSRIQSLGVERGGETFNEAFEEGPKLTYEQAKTLSHPQ